MHKGGVKKKKGFSYTLPDLGQVVFQQHSKDHFMKL